MKPQLYINLHTMMVLLPEPVTVSAEAVAEDVWAEIPLEDDQFASIESIEAIL